MAELSDGFGLDALVSPRMVQRNREKSGFHIYRAIRGAGPLG
jgi:hypothetical protein